MKRALPPEDTREVRFTMVMTETERFWLERLCISAKLSAAGWVRDRVSREWAALDQKLAVKRAKAAEVKAAKRAAAKAAREAKAAAKATS